MSRDLKLAQETKASGLVLEPRSRRSSVAMNSVPTLAITKDPTPEAEAEAPAKRAYVGKGKSKVIEQDDAEPPNKEGESLEVQNSSAASGAAKVTAAAKAKGRKRKSEVDAIKLSPSLWEPEGSATMAIKKDEQDKDLSFANYEFYNQLKMPLRDSNGKPLGNESVTVGVGDTISYQLGWGMPVKQVKFVGLCVVSHGTKVLQALICDPKSEKQVLVDDIDEIVTPIRANLVLERVEEGGELAIESARQAQGEYAKKRINELETLKANKKRRQAVSAKPIQSKKPRKQYKRQDTLPKQHPSDEQFSSFGLVQITKLQSEVDRLSAELGAARKEVAHWKQKYRFGRAAFEDRIKFLNDMRQSNPNGSFPVISFNIPSSSSDE
jgi:hypothetical protein